MGEEASIEQFAAAVGDEPLDVLINNAGVDGRALGVPDDERDVLELGAGYVLDEIRINAIGPMLLSRHLVNTLRAASNPRIVNISSTVGSMEVARKIGRDVGYVTSKAALNMITVKLANRLEADRIIAVAVHPGLLRTALATPRGDWRTRHVGAAELVDTDRRPDDGALRDVPASRRLHSSVVARRTAWKSWHVIAYVFWHSPSSVEGIPPTRPPWRRSTAASILPTSVDFAARGPASCKAPRGSRRRWSTRTGISSTTSPHSAQSTRLP